MDVAPPLLDNKGWASTVRDELLRESQHGMMLVFGGQMWAVVPRQQGKVVAVDGTFDVVDPVRVWLMVVFVLRIAIVGVHTCGPEKKKIVKEFYKSIYFCCGLNKNLPLVADKAGIENVVHVEFVDRV